MSYHNNILFYYSNVPKKKKKKKKKSGRGYPLASITAWHRRGILLISDCNVSNQIVSPMCAFNNCKQLILVGRISICPMIKNSPQIVNWIAASSQSNTATFLFLPISHALHGAVCARRSLSCCKYERIQKIISNSPSVRPCAQPKASYDE